MAFLHDNNSELREILIQFEQTFQAELSTGLPSFGKGDHAVRIELDACPAHQVQYHLSSIRLVAALEYV